MGVVLSNEPLAHSVFLFGLSQGPTGNAVMMSRPGHLFWRVTLELMRVIGTTNHDAIDLTGPKMLNVAAETWQKVSA